MRTSPVLGDAHNSNLLNVKNSAVLVAGVIVGVLAAALVGCKSVAPDAGHEVVLVEKPIAERFRPTLPRTSESRRPPRSSAFRPSSR